MKILIISTLNENSGSCVVIKNMINALEKRNIVVDLWAPSGNILEPKIAIPKGIISSLFFVFKNKKNISNYDRVVVYTIRGALIHLIIKGSTLYVHEINSKSKIKYNTINLLLNYNKSKLYVVNPSIKNKYPNCDVKTIGNIYDYKIKQQTSVKDDSVLMISAFSQDKGVDILLDLAVKCPSVEFKLLTTLLTSDEETAMNFKRYCASAPQNLFITTDQSLKNELLDSSGFLASLSRLDESFGIVIFEAVQNGCLPLVFSNTGSRYLLGDYPFLNYPNCVDSFAITKDEVKNNVDLKMIHRDFISRFNQNKVVNLFVDKEV